MVEGGVQEGGQTCTFTIIPTAHTTPHRLSTVPGEKMSQFADFSNRNSKLETRKSEIADHSMTR
jgi:hypothetical protein